MNITELCVLFGMYYFLSINMIFTASKDSLIAAYMMEGKRYTILFLPFTFPFMLLFSLFTENKE